MKQEEMIEITITFLLGLHLPPEIRQNVSGVFGRLKQEFEFDAHLKEWGRRGEAERM